MMPDPEASGVANVTSGQVGLWGSVFIGTGIAIRQTWSWILDRLKSKDDRLAKVEDDRFKLLMEEWKADRQSGLDQQKASNEIVKENTTALKALTNEFRDLKAAITKPPQPQP